VTAMFKWGNALESTLSTGANIGLQSASLITTAAQVAQGEHWIGDYNTAVSLGDQIATPTSTTPQGFANLAGQTNITNFEGPILSGLTGVVLGSDYFSDQFVTLADPTGAYNMVVPLKDPNFDYAHGILEAFDPVTDDDLSSVNISLSTLTTSSLFQLPPLTGTCDDTDASDPDSDDPDCDRVAPQSRKPGHGLVLPGIHRSAAPVGNRRPHFRRGLRPF
jgi:hypothetical protein